MGCVSLCDYFTSHATLFVLCVDFSGEQRMVTIYNFHQPEVVPDLQRVLNSVRSVLLSRCMPSSCFDLPDATTPLFDIRRLYEEEDVLSPFVDEHLGSLLSRYHVLESAAKRMKYEGPAGRLAAVTPLSSAIRSSHGRLLTSLYLSDQSWIFTRAGRAVSGAMLITRDECNLERAHETAADVVREVYGVLSVQTRQYVSRDFLTLLKSVNGGNCIGSYAHPVTIRRHFDLGIAMDAAHERSMYYEIQVDIAYPLCGSNEYFSTHTLSTSPHLVDNARAKGAVPTEFDVYLNRIHTGMCLNLNACTLISS